MSKTREKLEKAIKHFENMRDNAIVVLDSGFGSKPGENNLLYRNRRERAQLAIDALEKQIPQKPDLEGDGYYNGELVIDTGICPRCRQDYEIECHTPKFCENCGQALDWGDVE